MAKAMMELTVGKARAIAVRACIACGASPALAQSLVEATLSAEIVARREVGLAHLLDYLDAMRAGRIDGKAEPIVSRPLPAFVHVDAKAGIAQLGFDLAFDDLARCAMTYGVAIFSQSNSYTTGELGYYVRRQAAAGAMAIACANTHAMVAPLVGLKPVFGTNPLAFAAPLPAPRPPLVIDQSASATAFVNVARAAAEGRRIPEGWAVDTEGRPTCDPIEAVRGALLPFGGAKGANVALLVEVLAAGLGGASWSLDAGHFRQGHDGPGVGLTVVAIAAEATGSGAAERLAAYVDRIAAMGIHVPGRGSRLAFADDELITIEAEVIAAIEAAA